MDSSDPPFQDPLGPEPDKTEPSVPASETDGSVAREGEVSATSATQPPEAREGVALSAAFTGTASDAAAPPRGGAIRSALAMVQSHPRPLVERVDRDQVKDCVVRGAKVVGIVFCAWFTVVIFLIAVYRFVNPPVSTLMAMQWMSGTTIKREWVPIERISPNLMRAVIVSEDGRFCSHWGIDFGEVLAAIKRMSNGVPRGASTITMQVAKNLFLWPAKSYVRKVIEVPLTYAIELMWPKRRILEVYLNIAEWGPGIFGAEAAARTYFKRPASRLNTSQAARLAVALPNPVARNAARPGAWTRRRATVIQRRAAQSRSAASCVLPVR